MKYVWHHTQESHLQTNHWCQQFHNLCQDLVAQRSEHQYQKTPQTHASYSRLRPQPRYDPFSSLSQGFLSPLIKLTLKLIVSLILCFDFINGTLFCPIISLNQHIIKMFVTFQYGI